MIVELIAKDTGLTPDYIRKIIRSANYRYKLYNIPKRKGGFREVAHPSSTLKLLQRWVAENIFNHLPIHKAVFSYRSGICIKELADIHKKNNFLLRIDFKDFFPSISARDIAYFLKKNYEILPHSLSDADIKTVGLIVCKDNNLIIGSPSSPVISNVILYDFDNQCDKMAQNKDVIYSRYADDIYFSTDTPDVLDKIYREFQDELHKLRSPKLFINKDKTILSSKKRRRIITGLVLTSDNKVSVGRAQKRFIKGLIHRYIEKQLEPKQISYLKGYLAYLNSVEPNFIKRLKIKFGKKIFAVLNKEKISP